MPGARPRPIPWFVVLGVLVAATAGLSFAAGSQGAAGHAASATTPQRRATRGLGAASQATATPKAVRFDVALAPRHAGALRTLAAAVSSPGSPAFRHYLTPARFVARFAPTRETVARATRSLRRRGIRVAGVSANRLLIHIVATPSAARRAFASSPAAVVGLDARGAYTPAGLTRAQAGPQLTPACAQQIASAATSYPGSVLDTATDLAHAYGFDALYATGDLGQGTTIAVVEFAPFLHGDIATAQACYGTNATVNEIPVDGGAGAATSSGSLVGNEVETTLDVETIIGLAPAATVDVYEAPASVPSGLVDTFSAAIMNPAVDVISVSYGLCEPLVDAGTASSESTLFHQAAVEGKTIVSASGDSGSEDCNAATRNSAATALAVDNPASQPYVTGVGGTTLQSVGQPPSEVVWNNQIGSGGGGVSSLEQMPTYQAASAPSLRVVGSQSACPSGSGKSGQCREVPDVSSDAGAPLAVYCTEGGRDGCAPGGWTGIYGTSMAAPTWGALFALASASPACGGKAVGFANPALYAIAGGSAYASAFNDVTQGSNDLGFHGGLYTASVGYDLATGLGTPIAGTGSGTDSGLVTQLCKAATALAAPTATKVAPGVGPASGGTKVTITGTNLSAVTAVAFGTGAATSFTVASATTIIAVAPAGSGTVPIKLTTTAGTVVDAKTFRYLARPHAAGIKPKTGPQRGGTRVTISGSGFELVSGVRFGSSPARSFHAASAAKLVAVAPPGHGTVRVMVTTPGGTSAKTAAVTFRYTTGR